MASKHAVFVVSLILVALFVGVGILAPEELDVITGRIHETVIASFGWGYLLAAFAFVIFSLYMAFGPYGRLRLGNDFEKPQYTYFGWFSMLFAAGMGIGLIFWGVAEPLSHYLQPPDYIAPQSGEAAGFAVAYSFFHWGIHPWAIYIVMSLSIAYFSFRRGMPPLISSCFYPLIGERIYGGLGYAIDILAVFATVFGIATSLGLGAMQITGGLAAVLPIAGGIGATLIVIAVVTVLYMISSMVGLDKGIQVLSRGNVMVALALMTAMLILGPTAYILNVFTTTIGEYLASLVSRSLDVNPFEGHAWTQSWTLFYWAWWISWSPFVGLFVASISRGRTVREFVLGALAVPALLTFFWFAVFGGASLHLELERGISIAERAVADVPTALFEVYAYYPGATAMTAVTLVLLSVFFITSADSATYVLAMMTSQGNLSPPIWKRVTWGVLQSSAAAVLLLSGGLEALQRMAILAALPFTVVMLLMARGLLNAMRYERLHERSSGPTSPQSAVTAPAESHEPAAGDLPKS